MAVGLLAAIAGMLMSVVPTAASCLPPVPIDEALRSSDSIFVGTVAGLANQGRTATFAVDEVWRGPDLPARAVVNGGPEGNTFTSVDRTWEAGAKYLVFASVVDTRLTDNACSNTQIWTDELAVHRPTDARPPSDATDEGSETGIGGPLLALILTIALIGIVGYIAFRNRPQSG
jgi:hypothetical protein